MPAEIPWEKLRSGLAETEERLVQDLGPPDSRIDEFYKTFTLPNGYDANLKIWRSNTTPLSERPLILLFHGGGFFGGSIEMMTRPGRELAKAFGAVVVSSSYRLAPENRWPTSVMDGLEMTKWLSMHSQDELGANPAQGFIVGGFSSGGNMAAVIAQQAQKEDLPHPITGCFLGIPLLLIEDIVPAKYRHLWTSRKDNADRNSFFGDKDDEANVRLIQADASSPLFSPINDLPALVGMPRTYLQMGENDPLRDDGVVCAKALEDAGVEARMHVEPDVDHQCFSIWSNEQSPKSLKIKTMESVAWLLGRRYTETV